ncbi:hypothetical protein [Candidatus Korobacter versatilis]|uniref:hypothetical protein n=1 Tax=Candidatus Korobacter versatilis TaxID=658062 RepID=UPI0002F8AD5B|nr:hypothetical protein [Candidatus Koribacter versatilis]
MALLKLAAACAPSVYSFSAFITHNYMFPWQYRRLTELVRTQLEMIRNEVKNHADAITESSKAQIEANNNPPVLTNTLQIPSETIESIKSESGDQKKREDRKVRLELWTIAIVAVYTIVTFCLWWDTHNQSLNQSASIVTTAAQGVDQLRLSRQAMQIDQRAWLKVGFGGIPIPESVIGTDVKRSFSLTSGQPIFVPVRFSNIGKTPLLRMKGTILVDLIPMGKEPDVPTRPLIDLGTAPTEEQWRGAEFNKADFKVRSTLQVTAAIIYPSDASEMSLPRTKISGHKFMTPPLSQAEALDFASDKNYLAIFGELHYLDVLGVEHWVKFCENSHISQPSRPIAQVCCLLRD